MAIKLTGHNLMAAAAEMMGFPGWAVVNDKFFIRPTINGTLYTWNPLYSYSAAFQILSRMLEDGWTYSLHGTTPRGCECDMYHPDHTGITENAPTMQQAILLAALAANRAKRGGV